MIFIGSDHGGFVLKELLIPYLEQYGTVENRGVFNGNSCDYPDVARDVCQCLLATQNYNDIAILICGTGIGMSIAANKIHGIRAAIVGNEYSARMAKQHNNANVICLGARVIGAGLAMSIVDAFLSAKFEGGRHEKRVNKIEEL